jgi:hypothetical protein
VCALPPNVESKAPASADCLHRLVRPVDIVVRWLVQTVEALVCLLRIINKIVADFRGWSEIELEPAFRKHPMANEHLQDPSDSPVDQLSDCRVSCRDLVQRTLFFEDAARRPNNAMALLSSQNHIENLLESDLLSWTFRKAHAGCWLLHFQSDFKHDSTTSGG